MTVSRLQAFADDELVRAPLAADMMLQLTIEALQRASLGLAPGERKVISDLLLSVASQRPRLADRYVASLREQVQAELARRQPGEQAKTSTSALSLVDDEEVAVDVVLSHSIEAIRSVAEHELRELLAFTSALAGDMDVGADHNPFRAETQARALWAMAQGLPLTRGHQVALMRYAAMPLAQTLRKTYAAACTRLESEGTEPAAYRTVIPPAGARTRRVLDLSITQPLSPIDATAAPRSLAGAPASAASEEELDTLLGRLFGAMTSDRRLPSPLRTPIARMQAFVRKAALANPLVLENHSHPIWTFIDRLAFIGTVNPGPDDEELDVLLRFAAQLLDQLGEESRHGESLSGWAIERLERYEAKRLADRAAQVQGQIATMQQLEDKLLQPDASISTLHGTIDVPQLDTVPSELLDQAPSVPEDSLRWVRELRAGQWLRVFHRARWVDSQLIWPGERGEIWLFGDGDSDDTWAIRRTALQMLRESQLARHEMPRSLIGDAKASLARRS